MKPRMSMITLGVRDLAAAVRFYRDGLGFPLKEEHPEIAFFTLDGTWLGLYGREALAEDALVPAEGSGFSGVALAHNVSSEAEVDRLLAQAVEAGALAPAPSGISAGCEANTGTVMEMRASRVRVVLVRIVAPDKLGP